ncbi:MAG: hypothetical protein KO464_09890 [Candidatus Methanofastidiosum sp.]|nr:hypothetical protein [Methanofastidiosum sp.]
MKAKLVVGLAIFMMVVAMASVSAQYPSVATGGSSSSPIPPGPTLVSGCNYSFVVDAPSGTFQSVQVVIGGVAYDMVYDNAAWRAEICSSSGQDYFYRITTRYGITFESSPHKI